MVEQFFQAEFLSILLGKYCSILNGLGVGPSIVMELIKILGESKVKFVVLDSYREKLEIHFLALKFNKIYLVSCKMQRL